MRTALMVLLWLSTFSGGLTQMDVCGTLPLRKRHARIIGGEDAPLGAWPWQASVHINSTLCGGSLISRRWVLTAARCLSRSDRIPRQETQMGENLHEVKRTVSKVIKHHDYDPGTHKNDLALLMLSSPVNFTDYIRPVCLAAYTSFFVGGGLPRPTRLFLLLSSCSRSVSNIQCNAAYGTGKVTTRMMCAGPDKRGKGFCKRDFGGSLVVLNGTRWIQVGVASFVTGCGYPDFPGVYIQVSRYQTWINNHTSEDQLGYIYLWSSASRTSPFITMLITIFSLLAVL